MKLQVFRAPTMAEALAQVKRVMGPDAIIMHTRTIYQRYCMGLRRREIVEITAVKGLQVPMPRQQGPAIAPPRLPVAIRNTPYRDSVRVVSSAGAKAVPATAPFCADSRIALMERPEVGSILVREIFKEVENVKSMVKSLSTDLRHQHKPDVPEELFDFYQLMVSNAVEEQLAADVTRSVHRTVRPEYFQQPDFVKDKLAEQLEKLIPVAGPIRRTKASGAHVIALVGPTGVGKTTTIAKLAANLKVKERRRVGFVTIDTFRIAAVDQLKRYADILGAPLHVVHSPDEIGGAIGHMSGIDYILIDTAGRSPNDTLKIGELRHFIRTAAADEVHLVLSMTSSRSCLELAADRFGDVNIDKVIFTKLDEAANTGLLLSLVRTMNKSVSYITTGQDVPADIEPASARRIAQLILGSDV